MDPPTAPKSWSIHTRPDITAKYEILHRVGSGAYADVYRGRRLSDGVAIALKEVHDYQSAFREIEALQALRGHPNVVSLIEYFWREDEDAVLVLEFLRTDLASVIADAKKTVGGISAAEVKTWMAQILSGVEACHRMMIVHRDLKPGNLLIGDDGSLKLADFGQARILMDTGYDVTGGDGGENPPLEKEGSVAPPSPPHEGMSKAEEYLRVLDEVKEGATTTHDGADGGSCVATCTASEPNDYYESYDHDTSYDHQTHEGCLTSCVGTRWFRAPELLFGSTDYGVEIDLWSAGCIFAELLTLNPLFPGQSDIDQLSKIIDVLGNLTEEVWPGCAKLPDYKIISFEKVESPVGLGPRLPGRSAQEVSLVKRLVCFDPARRASAAELARDAYFEEEPRPVPISELRVPLTKTIQDDDDDDEGFYGDLGSDSDSDVFDSATVTTTNTGFSIRFS